MMAANRMPLEALLLVFTLLSSVLFVQAALDIQKKTIKVRKLNVCKGTENSTVQFTNIAIIYNGDTKENMLELKLTVLAEVSNNFAMKFSFWKCDASGSPDSCEYVLKDFVSKEVCKYMVKKKQAWSPFIEHFDKPLICPIQPGIYNLRKSPISTELLRYLPISDAIWKVTLWGYDLQKFLSCMELELQVAPFLGGRRRGGK